MSERDPTWEQEAHVRRTVVFSRELCARLAAEAVRRGVTFDELVAEYVATGLGEAPQQ
ncbi:MAG: hypothetical protein QOJ47_868 [Gaiellales bacterium]|jgi:hypothetical protein|nr:hypothetical protein [Gaiellales bacterium]